MEIDRRAFALSAAALLAAPGYAVAQSDAPWAGSEVIDCHHHMRSTLAEDLAHVAGAGISRALPIGLVEGDLIVGPEAMRERMRKLDRAQRQKLPGWLCAVDPLFAGAVAQLEAAAKAGASGFGEIKSARAADSPEMRRIYAAAAELGVPVLIHFDATHATGFQQLEKLLKAFPNCRFVGHAPAFWARIDAGYDGVAGYPTGRITPGGLTDRLLSDYGNLFGDVSAGSGYNALHRDPQFTPGFLERHQRKLLFGSDCFCTDGKGAGTRTATCQARETLTLIIANSSLSTFRRIASENAKRVYRLKV